MGQEQALQVSRVHMHVLIFASLNTLDITVYIPTNKSEYSLSNTRETHLRDESDIDHIAIGLISLLIHNHPILYLLYTTSKFKISIYLQTIGRFPTRPERITETATSPRPNFGEHSTSSIISTSVSRHITLYVFRQALHLYCNEL